MQRRSGEDGLWETGRGRGATHLGVLTGCRQGPRGSSTACPELGPSPASQNSPESLLRPEEAARNASWLEETRDSAREGSGCQQGSAPLKEYLLHSQEKGAHASDFSSVHVLLCEVRTGSRAPHLFPPRPGELRGRLSAPNSETTQGQGRPGKTTSGGPAGPCAPLGLGEGPGRSEPPTALP